jgi:hypothetical protein
MIKPCPICTTETEISHTKDPPGRLIGCSRCGEFGIELSAYKRANSFLADNTYKRALASHLVRKMATAEQRPIIGLEFFDVIRNRKLPRPAEVADNIVIYLAEQSGGSPGTPIAINSSDLELLAIIGVQQTSDLRWSIRSLETQELLGVQSELGSTYLVQLSHLGWLRFEELQQAQISSNHAFFARQFHNPDLDDAFENCLRAAVAQTGYELRTVTQRAGLIDAVIEDEIRRCRFLIADLSDDNAGAYWEAGFAEGLGKPVIYICRAKTGDTEKPTHFDTSHRHTVRWDLASLDETARNLKAVIRNTLLGDAKQSDE